MVFVFTDLEGSTPMAEFDPVTFDYLLQVHDSIIRETLATEGGYEMNTQGDEFQLAFPSILPAVRFCMTLQVCATRRLRLRTPRRDVSVALAKNIARDDRVTLARTATSSAWAHTGDPCEGAAGCLTSVFRHLRVQPPLDKTEV